MTPFEQILSLIVIAQAIAIVFLFDNKDKVWMNARGMGKDLLGLLTLLHEKNIATAEEVRYVTPERVDAYVQQLNEQCNHCEKKNICSNNKLNEE